MRTIVVITDRVLGRADEIVQELMSHEAVANVKLAPCLDFDVESKQHRGVTGRRINLLNPATGQRPGWSTTPHQYAEFVADFVRSWRDRGAYRSFLVEPATAILRALDGHATGFTHFDERKDPFIFTLYPDGRIGSNDELRMPDAELGHVNDGVPVTDLLAARRDLPVFNTLRSLLEECEGCLVRDVCRGGSLADRARFSERRHRDEYCDSRIELIDAVRGLTCEMAHAS